MTGEYFSWLSHDDKYEPDKISKSIYELAKFQDPTTPVVCGYKVINSENNILYDVNPLSQYTKKNYNGHCLPLYMDVFMAVPY